MHPLRQGRPSDEIIPKTGGALKTRWLWAAAFAAALVAFLFPIYNPDLFWHLSAGREMLENGAIPSRENFSFTLLGASWQDFEWLSQMLFISAYRVGGFWALWLLKGLLLGAIWLVADRTLARAGVSGAVRACALAFWSIGAICHADIRPELFSLLGTAGALWLSAEIASRRLKPAPGAFVAVFAAFALWSNLHAGFLIGLLAFLVYGLAELIEGRRREAAVLAGLAAIAALGACANPFGLGPYQVAFSHMREGAQLSTVIKEWHPLSLENPLHWPIAAGILLTGAAIVHGLWRRDLAWAPAAFALYLAISTLRHNRIAAYFNLAAALFLATTLKDRVRPALAAAAVYSLFALWLTPRVSWRAPFNDKFVARRAVEFVSRNAETFAPLRVYNQWEWGGYLHWREPRVKVFWDGRYLFHPLMIESVDATRESTRWARFCEKHALDAALVLSLNSRIPTERRYPDGRAQRFLRPWYLFYFPFDRWALVYWDEQALLFVRRDSVAPEWLAANEYRYLRPKDEAAFEDALTRGEIPPERLRLERERRIAEAERSLAAQPPVR